MRNPIEVIKNFFSSKGVAMNTEKANWFKDEIEKTRYKDRISRVEDIDDYLRRNHKVLQIPSFQYKEHTFEPTRLVLQTLRSIIKFHSSYICGSPVSITGDKEFVSLLNTIYKRGGYAKTDLEIAKDLITYGDTFEYVYLDGDKIKSKLIRNKDSYPLYDSFGNYTHFVEYWKDEDTRADHYVVYYPEKVEIYENSTLVDTKPNLTGLPIWYSAMDKSKYDKFGDPFPLDLMGIMDTIESLLSKLDTAVLTLSLSPIGIISGQRFDDSSIPRDMVGAVLNIEEGGSFSWANAQMDRESIKLELDYVIQQFYAIACVPASIMGQSNVAKYDIGVLNRNI